MARLHQDFQDHQKRATSVHGVPRGYVTQHELPPTLLGIEHLRFEIGMLTAHMLHKVGVPVAAGLLPDRAATTAEVLDGDLILVIAARSEVEACDLSRREGRSGITGDDHNLSCWGWEALGSPYVKCPWRSRTFHCEKVDLVDTLETGMHITNINSAPVPRFKAEMKVFAQEMIVQGLKPVHIRNAILCKFNLAADELPTLSKIQHFCQRYASTKLGSNDYVKEIRNLIRDTGYVSTMDEYEGFTFTLSTYADGLSAVGMGFGAYLFIVGVRHLDMKDSREVNSLPLHVDATFKLNQRKEDHFTEMVAALQQIYNRVIGKPLVVKAAPTMSSITVWKTLLVKMRSFRKTRSIQPARATKIMTGVYDMHISLCKRKILVTKTRELAEWADVPELAGFTTYFKAQRLSR
ncbi:Hypothetical protein PHPALM_11957 [Phytophthora palmivora]|uniref:Uncharacterized protein n=1 Tax=Phytophthora palmivora TaxID=4796 RepID=A0A2P4Y0Y3_9STRA|nr:Hypothetical protein PHPALM_11957 [Phytophthora palmivora]